MSSIIDRTDSQAKVPANGQAASRVVVFDATVRRKEKMRRRAANEPQASPAKPGNGTPVRVTAPPSPQVPVAEVPVKAVVQMPEPTVSTSASPSPDERTGGSAMPLDDRELEKYLVAFVVEQTGYPEEMVELDADLEADLGIDSIKKAQLFGELAEQFQIDVQGAEEMSLDDYPTLRHVMHFLQAASPSQSSTAAANISPPAVVKQPAPVVETPAVPASPTSTPTEPTSAPAALSGTELEQFLIDFVVEQTGYPQEMVELDADLEADLGIDSIKKAQLFGELAEQFDVNMQSADELSLDDFPTLRHVMTFLEGSSQRETGPPAQTDAPVISFNPTATISSTPSAPNYAPVAAVQTSDGAASVMSGAELEEYLVNFVVEQTGYPPEMVEMDADLEADLGIDSIKKAQLFGELAERFEVNIQSAEEMSLDDYPTLRHVMKFLEGAPQKATA